MEQCDSDSYLWGVLSQRLPQPKRAQVELPPHLREEHLVIF